MRALRLVEVEPRPGGFHAGARHRARAAAATWCCWPWGSPARSAGPLVTDLGVEFDSAATWPATATYATSVPGVFVAGDMGRGQSLIVWAIAEGRSAAAAVDPYLSGETTLPAAISPTARPLT